MKLWTSALLFVVLTLSSTAHAELKAENKSDLRPEAKPENKTRSGRLTQGTACTPAGAGDLIKLDFDNASVHDLAAEVGRVLCKNFVVDPKLVRLPVYVLSAAQTKAGDLWPNFLAILSANELTVVEHSGYYSIIYATEATREPVPGYGPSDALPAEDRMVTKILDVKGRDPATVSNFLNIFKSGKGQIHAYPSNGILVVTDYASSISRLEWILAQTGKPATK